jgi:hypothetical protein
MSEAPKKSPVRKQTWGKVSLRVIRWTWIPLTCVIACCVGLAIGYVYLGKQAAGDMLDLATWRHLFDLVFAEG